MLNGLCICGCTLYTCFFLYNGPMCHFHVQDISKLKSNHNRNKDQMPNIITRGECSISKPKSFPNKHRIILPFPIIIHVSRDGSVALDTDQPLFAAPILDAPEVCASAVVTLEDIIVALTLALC